MAKRRFRRTNRGAPSQNGRQVEPACLVQELVTERAGPLTQKVIELAMAGSERCLLLCLDRILPQHRPIDFKLPAINSVEEMPAAMAAVTSAVTEGKLTAEAALQFARLLESYAQVLKTHDFAARLDALEAGTWGAKL
jgi:hypothetical protein